MNTRAFPFFLLAVIALTSYSGHAQAPVRSVDARLAEIDGLIVKRLASKAEPLARALVAELEVRDPGGSLDLAVALHRLLQASWYMESKDGGAWFAALAERAIRMFEAFGAPNHPGIVDVLVERCEFDEVEARYTEARASAERAVATAGRLTPQDPVRKAAAEYCLGFSLFRLGDRQRAESLLRSALAVQERELGPVHATVALTWHVLGLTLASHHPDSLAALERGLAIREEVYGPSSPITAISLTGTGATLLDQGDLVRGQALLLRALAIRQKAGRAPPTTLLWLGAAAHEIGDLDKAQEYLLRAEAIHRQSTPVRPDLGHVLTELGVVALERQQYDVAEARFSEAYAILSPTQRSQSVADLLRYWADLALARGQSARARELNEQSLKRTRSADGLAPVAWAMSTLQQVRLGAGEPGAGKAQVEQSLEILNRMVGPATNGALGARRQLAAIADAGGDRAEAWAQRLETERLSRARARLTVATLPEHQAMTFAAKAREDLEHLLAEVERQAPNRLRSVDTAFDAVIRARALVQDELAPRDRPSLSADPKTAALVRELTAARTQLARLTVRGAGPLPMESFNELLKEKTAIKERAEIALGSIYQRFRETISAQQQGLSEVRRLLPASGALVSYVKYHDRYGAFVLAPAAAEPQFIALGPAPDIDTAIRAVRGEIAREAASGGRAAKANEARYRAAGVQLRSKIWDPIAGLVTSAAQVFVVADGALHLVNFAALPAGRDRFLVDGPATFHYLTAERDLTTPVVTHRSTSLLALGDPDFDDTRLFAGLSGDPKASTPGGAAPRAGAGQTFRGQRAECDALQSLRFERLPQSALETNRIAGIWKSAGNKGGVTALRNGAANETAFKELAPGSRIVHLATHGFFLGGDCLEAASSDGNPTIAAHRSPLLLSGLALAGANRREAAGPDEDDGVLTAEEVSALDLSSVEWAVLSACDTGLGTIATGEGVFGLRRAFHLAGAATVVMSLWSVEDEASQAWMSALYRARARRQSTIDAVRSAYRTVLADRRTRGASTHPFYWAAFVAAGDWR
jgi:CHAT domain-containing protein/tetratricopeptide (TPR) repeat protein